MVLIIIWLFFILCCMTGAMDTPVMQFLFVSFLVVVIAGGLYCYAIVSKDEKEQEKEKKARLKREKQIQKEETLRKKREAKENQKQHRKDEKESRKRRRKEKRQNKKLQKQALKQAKRDFFVQRRLVEKQDKLQKKLQKKLDRYNRKEVMITQPVQTTRVTQAYPKVKRDKSKPVKLTSFILPIVIFMIMMGCIISTQIISVCDSYTHTQVITDYHSIAYDDSS